MANYLQSITAIVFLLSLYNTPFMPDASLLIVHPTFDLFLCALQSEMKIWLHYQQQCIVLMNPPGISPKYVFAQNFSAWTNSSSLHLEMKTHRHFFTWINHSLFSWGETLQMQVGQCWETRSFFFFFVPGLTNSTNQHIIWHNTWFLCKHRWTQATHSCPVEY